MHGDWPHLVGRSCATGAKASSSCGKWHKRLSPVLSLAGFLQVGLLDVDICGPSVPKLTGLENQEIHRSNLGWSPVYVEDNLAVMSIGFLLPNPDDAVIWRGPRKNGLIKQFLKVASLLLPAHSLAFQSCGRGAHGFAKLHRAVGTTVENDMPTGCRM